MRRLVTALFSLGLLACDPTAKCPECPDAAPADCPKAKTKTKTKVVHGGPPPAEDKGDIKLTFAEPKSKRLDRFKAQLSGSKLFGKVIDGINDTIALALFRNGFLQEAIDHQQQALDAGGRGDPDYQHRMDKYQAAKKARDAAKAKPKR